MLLTDTTALGQCETLASALDGDGARPGRGTLHGGLGCEKERRDIRRCLCVEPVACGIAARG